MPPHRHFPSRDRLSVLIAVILLAYALSRFLDLPAQAVDLPLFGAVFGLALTGPLLVQVLVAALISTGADALIRSHPRFAPAEAQGPARSTVTHWVVPGAAALVLGAGLERLPNGPAWWLGLGGAALALTIVLIAEFTVVDPEDAGHDAAALALSALTYGLGLILFALLRNLSARPSTSALIGGIVATGLAWRLFTLGGAPARRSALYALVIGLLCAEAVWAVAYWRLSTATAAGLLLVVFYVGVGLAGQMLAGRLTRRAWLEYGLVGLAAVALLALYH